MSIFLSGDSRPCYVLFLLGGVLLGAGVGLRAQTTPKPTGAKTAPVKGTAVKASAGAYRLTYGFEAGKTYHYKMTALFTGQIPGLSEPGKNVNFIVELGYAAAVKKQDATGTTVDFSVEQERIGLLQNEPGPDAKVDPKDVLDYPLPLSQVQGMLNVTALLKPDGSIASVTGGSNNPIKVDLGVDLRKLFVLMMPIVFPNHAVSQGDEWPFDEGFLGHKPGATTYKGHLAGVQPAGKNVTFVVTQDAQSTVDDKINKEGNSTSKPEEQVGVIAGKVTATSTMSFQTAKPNKVSPGATDTPVAGRLTSGKLELFVDLKRTLPDQDHPDKNVEAPITVHARMFVTALSGAPKPATKTTASNPSPKSGASGQKPIKEAKR